MTALVTTIALLAALAALRYWMADPGRVRAEIEALTDIPAHVRAELLDCIDAAQEADRKTWLYD